MSGTYVHTYHPTTKGVTMKHRTILTVILALAVLALGGAAQAASLDDVIALGYSTHRTTGVAACLPYNSQGIDDSAHGYGASVDFGCLDGPGYDAAVSDFVAGHAERKLAYEHPAAAAARDAIVAKGYAVSVDYATASFNVTGGCDVNATVTADNLPTYAASLPTAAPCAPAPTTTTEATSSAPSPAPIATTPTDTTTTTDLENRVTALEGKVDVLAQKVASLEEAVTAAWDAYARELAAGTPPYKAALIARSVAMNVLYGLGQ